MNIQIRWADNTEQLAKHLKQGLDQIEATRAGAEKMVKALSGDRLIAAAHNMVAAIKEIGGAEKLTNAERERTNALLDKAIQKYQALGQEAPTDLRALFEATKHVNAENDKMWKGLENGLRSFASGAKTIGIGLTAALTAPIVAVGAAVTKLGIDAVESENLVSVSFGDMKQAAEAWSKDLSKNLGLNEFELRKTAGTIFNMTTSMGLGRKAAFDMSTGVAKLAADMASFRNIPMEEALTKIKSGLTGETEPLKAIGILVDENTVKEEAYRIGLVRRGQELTQQEKVTARWSAILRQTANDQGDLARTMDSPANQLRIMRTRLEEAATALGVQLMPHITTLVGWLSKLVEHVKPAVEWFGQWPDPIKNTALALGGLVALAGPTLYFMGGLADALARLIPLMKAMRDLQVAGTLVQWLGPFATPAGAAVLLALAGGAGAFLVMRQNLAELEKQAAKSAGPIKDINGQILYTAQTAQAAADALPPLTEGLTFLGKPLNATGAAVSNFGTQLAAARKELADLQKADPKKLADIAAAIKSGVIGMEELKKQSGLSETALNLLKKQIEAQKKATDAANKANEKFAETMREMTAAAVPLQAILNTIDGTVLEGVRFYLAQGKSVKEVATFYGLLETQVEAVQTQMKFEQAAVDATDKAFGKHAGQVNLLTARYGDLHEAIRGVDDDTGLLIPTLIETDATLGHIANQTDFLAAKTERYRQLLRQLRTEQAAGPWKDLSSALGTLANDFAQLAQIAGDSFAPYLRVIGESVKATEIFIRTTAALDKAMKDGVLTIGDYVSAIGGYLSLLTVAKSLIDAYQRSQDEARRRAGALAVSREVMRDFQILKDLSADLENQIRETYKEYQRFKNGLALAEAIHIQDIVKELGGWSNLTAQQLAVVQSRFTALFDYIAKWGPRSTAEIQALDEGLVAMGRAALESGGLVSKFFVDSIHKADQLGISLKGVAAFIREQLGAAAGGLTDLFKGLQESATAQAQAEARAKGAKPGESAADFEKRIGDIRGQIKLTQDEFNGLSAAVSANFFEMIEKGVSFADALKANQGAIDGLRQAAIDSGLDPSWSKPYQLMANMADIASDKITGPLASAIAGATSALKGLNNAGILDQDMFSGLTQTATEAYHKIIAQGKDGKAALALMQPQLQTIWQLQKDYGFTVDEATQGLLDQAVAAGIVGDKQRPIQEQMLSATKRIADAVEGLAKLFGVKLPESAEKGAKGVNDALDKIETPTIDIPVTYHTEGEPPEGRAPSGAARGGRVTRTGVQAFATGGIVMNPFASVSTRWPMPPVAWTSPSTTDIVPAMLTPGEIVLNEPMQAVIGELVRSAIGPKDAAAVRPIVLQEQFTFTLDVQAIDSRDMREAVEKDILPQILTEIEDRRRGYAGRLARTLATAGAT